MIGKLRRRIILVNMLMVGVVILLIFTIICYNNYQISYDDLEHGMNQTLMDTMKKDEIKQPFPTISSPDEDAEPGGVKRNRDSRANPMRLSSYVIAELDSDESVKNVNETNLFLTDTALSECVKIAESSHKKAEIISKYGLMYVRTDGSLEKKIIFAETGGIFSSLWSTIIISSILFVISMAVIFFISLVLSGFAVNPVKKAWTQQKQFVADASHELKTPLTVILANNNIMMSHANSKVTDERQWLESTEEEAQHMKELIDQMLFLAKSDAGGSAIEFSDVDFSDIVEGTSLNFEPVAFEKEIEILPEIDPGVIVHGNTTQLNQLAHILIDNAVKYSHSHSQIKIKLAGNGDNVTFSVNNFGNVISKEDLQHIFDRFYRAEKSRTTKGYGLGLSIAKNIVQSMNGKLTAESSEAEGTTFTASFKAR